MDVRIAPCGRRVHPRVRRNEQRALRVRVQLAYEVEKLFRRAARQRLPDEHERHLHARVSHLRESPPGLTGIGQTFDPVIAVVAPDELALHVREDSGILLDGDYRGAVHGVDPQLARARRLVIGGSARRRSAGSLSRAVGASGARVAALNCASTS